MIQTLHTFCLCPMYPFQSFSSSILFERNVLLVSKFNFTFIILGNTFMDVVTVLVFETPPLVRLLLPVNAN